MQSQSFLSRVLGDEGFYCLFAANSASDKRVQKFYATIEDMVNAAPRYDDKGYDTYFAPATFKKEGSRKRTNALMMRSFYLDLDCGDEKGFEDKAEAITALKRFCKELELPTPWLVDSGGGVHVYWALTEPVDVRQWANTASRLKRACVDLEFPADTAVTTDAVRVLRFPGTHNRKPDYEDAPAVSILNREPPAPISAEDMAGKLKKFTPALKDITGFSGRKMSSGAMDRLLGNRTNSFKAIMQRTLSGKGCAQLAYIVAERETMNEPMWRAGLSIAKHCEDAEEAAVLLSEGHPDYSKKSTLKKLRNIESGPYTCASFENLNPKLCGECPHWGKVKSPIVLGQETARAEEEDNEVEAPDDTGSITTHVIPEYPEPYFRGKNGGIYLETKDDDGDLYDICIYENDLYFTRRVYDELDGELVLCKLHLPNDTVREFPLTLKEASSQDKLREVLSAKGVVVPTKHWGQIMTYTTTWLSRLQADTIATETRRQFGWTGEDDELGSFCIGEKEIFPDHEDHNPPSSYTNFMYPAFGKKGTLEGWKAQTQFYNRPNMEPYHFMICLTMAAPLMAFTPHHAAQFCMHSTQSGLGKTTTQLFGLTAYGDPARLIIHKDDTAASVFNRADVYRHLPVHWDEMTNLAAADASPLIYNMAQGMQRNRMSGGSNVERPRGDPWATTVGYTSNESILAKVRSTQANSAGEAMRLLEYEPKPQDFAPKHETDMFEKVVGRHYGHAGEIFLKYVVANQREVERLMDATRRQLDERCGFGSPHRFWSTAGTVTLVAAMIAKKLELLPYNIPALFDWTVKLMEENMRSATEAETSIDGHLTNFIAENIGSFLIIKSTVDLRRKEGEPDLDMQIPPEQQPRQKLIGRYEPDTKQMSFLTKPFAVWCADQHLNSQTLLKELQKNYGATRRKVRLAKGTSIKMPPANCVVVDCARMDIDVAAPEDDAGEG